MASMVSAENIVIVAHQGSGIQQIARKSLPAIFLLESSRVGGEKVTVVDYSASRKIRAEFSKTFLGKSMEEIKALWIQKMVAEGTRPPKTKKSFKSIRRYLLKHPEAISYCYESEAQVEGLKIVPIN